MSNALASNTAEASVSAMVSVINSSVLNCNNTSYQSQDFTLKAGDGSDVNVTLDWNQAVSLDNACVQTSVNDTSIENDIDQAISQISTAIEQQFGALTASEADNAVKAVINLGVTVQNSYTTTCNQSVFQQQALDMEIGNRSVATVYANWDQTAQSMINCVQNDSSVTNAKDAITQDLSQAAKAVIENFLLPFLIAGVIIIVIFIVLIFLVGRVATPNLTGPNAEQTTALISALKTTE